MLELIKIYVKILTFFAKKFYKFSMTENIVIIDKKYNKFTIT